MTDITRITIIVAGVYLLALIGWIGLVRLGGERVRAQRDEEHAAQSRRCMMCAESDQYGQPSTGACPQCLDDMRGR